VPGEVYRRNLRPPSARDPRREVRAVRDFGHAVVFRTLEDGALVAFGAQNMALPEPQGYGFFAAPSGRALVLDPVSGEAHAADGSADAFLAIEHRGQVMLGDLYQGSQLALVLPEGERIEEGPLSELPVSFPEDDDETEEWENFEDVAGGFAALHPSRWTLEWDDGESVELEELVSWSALGRPFYSGIGVYRTAITVARDGSLGMVDATLRETAELIVNGHSCGVRAFGPYEWRNLSPHIRKGRNILEVRVANTLQGQLEGVERLSGLLRLRLYPA
jgi:hypothetical protein